MAKLKVYGPFDEMVIATTCTKKATTVQHTYLVDVCDEDKDRYRFGFNGQEKDNELKGTGNSLDFGARMYDSRLGKFLSLNPDMDKYPYLSPFAFADNNPIYFVDVEGKGSGKLAKTVIIIVPTASEAKSFAQFNGKTAGNGNTHYIVANNLSSAYNSLQKYSGGKKIENIVLDTHGGGSIAPGYMYVNNTKAKNENGSNVGTTYMNSNEVKSPSTPSMIKDVAGLKGIANMVQDNGKMVLLGCGLAKGKEGLKLMKDISNINTKISIYGSEAYANGAIGTSPKDGILGLTYNYYNRDVEVITHGLKVNTGDAVHTNGPNDNMVKISAENGKISELYNVTINGGTGDVKEVKSAPSKK